MATVKLSENFDIHLPKEVQDQMKLRPGQKFLIALHGDIISLVRDSGNGIEDLIGLAAGADPSGVRERP